MSGTVPCRGWCQVVQESGGSIQAELTSGKGFKVPLGSLDSKDGRVHSEGSSGEGLNWIESPSLGYSLSLSYPPGAAASAHGELDAQGEVEQLQQFLSYSLGWL